MEKLSPRANTFLPGWLLLVLAAPRRGYTGTNSFAACSAPAVGIAVPHVYGDQEPGGARR